MFELCGFCQELKFWHESWILQFVNVTNGELTYV
jgi:hypothetical protein